MIFFGLVFLAILIVVFSIVAFMTRPTMEQNVVQQRLATLVSFRLESNIVNDREGRPLMIEEPEHAGWFDAFLGKSTFARKIQVLILQSNKNTSVEIVSVSMVGLGLAAFLITYFTTSMALIASVVAVIVSYLPIVVLRFLCHRRIEAFNIALPDCIETCARALRAGHSIVAAIDIVTEQAAEPAKTEFSEVFKKQNYGLPLRDALVQMLERVPSPDLQVLITGILVQKDTGGNLAEILDRISSVVRDRIRIQGEIRIHTAQGRLTGWILFLLPLLMMFAINIVNPGYSSILFNNPLGKKILYAGLLLLTVGGLLIRQIVNGIEV